MTRQVVRPGSKPAAHCDLLAVIRAIQRIAILAGFHLPYHLVRDVVAKSAGYTSAPQMLGARSRGDPVRRLDAEILVGALAAWGVPVTIGQAQDCIDAGGT